MSQPSPSTDEPTPPANTNENNESTALLNGSGQSASSYGAVEPSSNGDPAARPDDYLNRTQIMLLAYCRMVETVAFFCIVPFINKMIFDLGEYPEADIGFYSGLIESLFSVVQMIMMIPWGRAADRFGRKPVLVVSLSGLCVTASLFGFSQSLWQMIILRCAAGAFGGSVVAVRSMIAENSTQKTQARAYSIFSFLGNIGIFLGVLVGGLADPASQYKRVFGSVEFFHSFPYAFPTIISGLLVLGALLATIFYVEETLDQAKSHSSSNGLTMSAWDVVKSPGVPNVLFVYVMAGMLGFSFTAVAPVFWFTSISEGGFGLSPQIISYFMALGGVSQAIWMLAVFPPLHARVGTGGILRLCAVIWPFAFALNPLANVALRHGLTTLFWSAVPFAIIISSGCAMAFTGVQLAVNDISPTPAALGTMNGISLSLQSGTRAFTPALFSSIFAIGIRDQILWGYLVWAALIAVALSYGAGLFWLPAKAEGKYQPVPQTDESQEA